MASSELELPCLECGHSIGDHTIRQVNECFANHSDFDLPSGVKHLTTPSERFIAVHLEVATGSVPTPEGELPVVIFTFTGPGEEEGTTRSSPAIMLVAEPGALYRSGQLVVSAVQKAIATAKDAGWS